MGNVTAHDLIGQGIDPRTYKAQRDAAGIVEQSKDCIHSPEKLLALEKIARNPKEIERKLKLKHYVPQVLIDHYFRTVGQVKFAKKEAQKAKLEQELTDAPLNVGAYTREELQSFRQEELIMLCRTYSSYGIDMRHCIMTTPPHHMINWILRGQQKAGVTLPNVDLAPDPQSTVINTAAEQVAAMREPHISHIDDDDLIQQESELAEKMSTPGGVDELISDAVGTGTPPAHLVDQFAGESISETPPDYINGPPVGILGADGQPAAPGDPASAFAAPPAIPADPVVDDTATD